MKLPISLILFLLQATPGVSSASAKINLSPIAAESKAGLSLLSKSRLLNEDENDNNENDNDTTWMQNYSIKFLGCHHVAHWNSDADGEDDVRIKVERHVRYRLCPSSSCSHKTSLGCKSEFGEYIVDMDTFLQSHLANKEDIQEQMCQNQLNQCGCGENDGDDDEDKCEYKCFKSAKMTECIDVNPYYDDAQNKQDGEFDMKDYTYCKEYNVNGNDDENDNNNDKDRIRRKLEGQEEEDNVEYFLGTYCSDSGADINLGLFTDDTCTDFADSAGGAKTFHQTYGSQIPYYGVSLVDNSCYTCKETDYYDGDSTKEVCEDIYAGAGKCENKLSANVIDYPNENACSYIDGIKTVKHSSNGVIYRKYYGTRKAALWIAFFATTFILLAFYVWLLRQKMSALMKLGLANNNRDNSNSKKKGIFKRIGSNLSPKKIKKKFSFRKNKSSKNSALL